MALVPTFCGQDYDRDVVLLSPAVREANGETKWCNGSFDLEALDRLAMGLHRCHGS
jgi:hypothetical protein